MTPQPRPLRTGEGPGRLPALRNVLVTGGAGFIGSNFLCAMVEKYGQIRFICFDALRPCASSANLQSIRTRANFVFVRGDICDSKRLLDTMYRYTIDAVVHFAAESSVDKSFHTPNLFAYSNIAGSMTLAECCRQAGISIVLHASTDEIYGESDPDSADAFNESSWLLPSNPYAITKAVADIVLRTWCDIPLIVVRSSNVYGPRQFPEKLIPKLICQRLLGLKYTIHGNGLNRRCYMYVSDCVNAFESILLYGSAGQIYNVGTQEELSNLEVAAEISRVFGVRHCDESVEFVLDRQCNDKRYWMSSVPVQSLGWMPFVSFPAGLKQTVEWYEENFAGHWRSTAAEMLAAHPVKSMR